ncbi:MAG: DUF2268 domain-containing putative Zn-dependent protease [Chitinophagaceae bacterium]
MRYLLKVVLLVIGVFPGSLIAQSSQTLQPGKLYKGIVIDKSSNLFYQLDLQKGGIYQVDVLQQGVAAWFALTDTNRVVLLKSKRPEDITGYLKREFSPAYSGKFVLNVKRFDDPENTDSGQISISINSLSTAEIARKNGIKKDLEPENQKNVQTADIDHFWEAFDHLKDCHSFSDSVATFQQYYLDRATDGLIEFTEVRDFTAEKFVQQVALYPLFFASIRKNTYEVKKAVPLIEEIFKRFSAIYANFKPFKVCFAIGIINTGGTVSNNFILIGTEITTSTQDVNLSEFIKYHKTNKAALLSAKKDIIQEIRNIVAHESVHTQQKSGMDRTATRCRLLYQSIKEGSADFIGAMISSGQINLLAHQYGDQHEGRLWTAFKNELCNENVGNWLYNGDNTAGKPADLGYYIGYKITEAYFNNAGDKKKAIADIIEMADPLGFLELSKYDQKVKK